MSGETEVSQVFQIGSQSYKTALELKQQYLLKLDPGELTFSSPTNFAPILNNALDKFAVDQRENRSRYRIFLILTDGIIEDFDATKRAIVILSQYPCSIIIVGIGSGEDRNKEFEKMHQLDSDEELLTD